MRFPPLATLALAALAVCSFFSSPVAAQTPLTLVRVADQLTNPVHVTHRAGDFQSLFIAEIGGQVRILRNGSLLATPYIDISSLVGSGFEQGLLGMAFHPDYPATKRIYLAYVSGAMNTVVESFDEDPQNPDRALLASGQIVLGPVAQPGPDHNGGCLVFGPDGMLYVGMGDGSSPNDSGPGHVAGGNAQSLGTVLGKILRLDVDLPYPHIPPSNPFASTPGARGEIWAYGLRNPWRFSFDRATGELYIGDVGEVTIEEIDVLPAGLAGANLGWRCLEGSWCTGLSGCSCTNTSTVLPVHEYDHNVGCSVTGGIVYRGCAIPSLVGTYVFADHCAATVSSFVWNGSQATNVVDRTTELGAANERFASFGEDELGEIYGVEYTKGEVWKLVPAQSAPDCDGDGSSDACEIAAGLEADVDQDGVPDSCAAPSCTLAPTPYCAGSNSLGCASFMQTFGNPSMSATAPFWITGSNVISQRSGILFYGESEAAIPFNGGTLCVGAPSKRTKSVFSFGQVGPTCSGEFSFDFNAHVQSGVNPFLVAGKRVYAQYLYREIGSNFPIAMTPAVKFDICP